MESNINAEVKTNNNISIYDWRSKFVILMFSLSVIIAITPIITGYSQYIMLSDMSYGISISEADIDRNDSIISVVGIVQTVIALLTVVSFLLWFHNTYKNTISLSNQPLKFSPGWSIGGFFIPLLNLVIPYKVAKEIWYASKDDDYDFNLLNKKPMVGFIMLWWLLFIFASGASRVSGRLVVKAEDVQDYINATVSYLISDALIVLGAITAIYLIKSFTNVQNTTLLRQDNCG